MHLILYWPLSRRIYLGHCKAHAISLIPQYWDSVGSLTFSWWRHQMETFSALLAICAGNSPVPGEFPAQRPVTRSFDVFFDLCLNKRLSKPWWGWWFETLSLPLWRHRNVLVEETYILILHSQYRNWWRFCDHRSNIIDSRGILLIIPIWHQNG